ncbi:hypothetical protein SAURM35S_07553 [Streptomyces aurantiogriseus]
MGEGRRGRARGGRNDHAPAVAHRDGAEAGRAALHGRSRRRPLRHPCRRNGGHRQGDDPARHGRRHRRVRRGRRGRRAHRLRRRGDPRRPRLPHRPVPVGGHQPPHGRLRRRPGGPYEVRGGDRRGRTADRLARVPDPLPLLAVEAGGLRRASRRDPGGAGGHPQPARRGRRRRLPRLHPPLLAPGVRRLRPQPRGLDEEAHRQARHHRRLGRSRRRLHQGLPGRELPGQGHRRSPRQPGARRVRPGGRGPPPPSASSPSSSSCCSSRSRRTGPAAASTSSARSVCRPVWWRCC